jgi:hypothetical protein
MIKRVLVITTISSNRNGEEGQEEWHQLTAERAFLKFKLLTVFSFTLVINAANVGIYTLKSVFLPDNFGELGFLSASGLALYIALNCK